MLWEILALPSLFVVGSYLTLRWISFVVDVFTAGLFVEYAWKLNKVRKQGFIPTVGYQVDGQATVNGFGCDGQAPSSKTIIKV